jgi:hypothetical protein
LLLHPDSNFGISLDRIGEPKESVHLPQPG